VKSLTVTSPTTQPSHRRREWKRRLLDGVERIAAGTSLQMLGDRPGLLAFLFHGIRIEKTDSQTCDPNQLIAPDVFARFLDHFAQHGYEFTSPADLEHGLSRDGRYVMITFDDGYYNNTAAIPVLEQFACPATFFIATGHIESGEAFWWDTVYRERSRQHVSISTIAREFESLKEHPFHVIRDKVIKEFGGDVFETRGDQDRPMTTDELRSFAAHPLVHLGNHTVNHAILTACSVELARDQITRCQEALARLVGVTPDIISYPNGNVNPDVVEAAKGAGLRFGITTVERKNHLTSVGRFREPMRIHRMLVTESSVGDGLFRSLRAPISVRRMLHNSPLRHLR